jgi:hypothetical protein
MLLAILAGVPLASPFSANPDEPMLGLPKGSSKIVLPGSPGGPSGVPDAPAAPQ